MAAPHVTGAIAALKSVFPNITVEQLKVALADSGVILALNGGVAKPRILVDRAVQVARGELQLKIAPSGDIFFSALYRRPFSPTHTVVHLSSSGGEVSYSIRAPGWLSVVSEGGVEVANGVVGPSGLNIRLEPKSFVFPVGTLSDTIIFTNLTIKRPAQSIAVTAVVTANGKIQALEALPGDTQANPAAVSLIGPVATDSVGQISAVGTSCSRGCRQYNTLPVLWSGGAVIPLSLMPGSNFATATAMSSNGLYAVGYGGSWTSPSGISECKPLLWSLRDNSVVAIGDSVAAGCNVLPKAVNNSGQLVIGGTARGASVVGWTWRLGEGQQILPPPPQNYADYTASAMSEDASVIIGTVSKIDGNVLRNEVIYWSFPGPQIQILAPPSGFASSFPVALSSDGRTLLALGSLLEPLRMVRSFLWTESAGWENIGTLGTWPAPTNDLTVARGMSSSGDVVIGESNGGNFIWSRARGIRSLAVEMSSGGVSFEDWEGFSGSPSVGVSPDGAVALGSIVKSGQRRIGWAARLPRD